MKESFNHELQQRTVQTAEVGDLLARDCGESANGKSPMRDATAGILIRLDLVPIDGRLNCAFNLILMALDRMLIAVK